MKKAAGIPGLSRASIFERRLYSYTRPVEIIKNDGVSAGSHPTDALQNFDFELISQSLHLL
ncbi:MAG TPA: hypothetical protein VMR33_15090 [Candidatus Baltobacteraceae bacterium]|nr:hypothetical protein [Candidatus Baltobacteraceae bacterium]